MTLAPWAIALLPLLGAVVGALFTGIFLIVNNHMTIKAARERDNADRDHKRRERREERLHAIVSELLGFIDSDGNLVMDPKQVVTLIARAQLLLDYQIPADGALNNALNHLGVAADRWREHRPTGGAMYDSEHQHRVRDAAMTETRVALLKAHSDLLDSARALVR